MSGAEILLELAKVAGAVGGAWLAVRVELRWLRADVERHERRFDYHDTRLHALEVDK